MVIFTTRYLLETIGEQTLRLERARNTYQTTDPNSAAYGFACNEIAGAKYIIRMSLNRLKNYAEFGSFDWRRPSAK